MTYTQSDFLTEIGTLGFIQAVTNALLSLLPESDPEVVAPPLEESASAGVNEWSEQNLGDDSGS